MPKTTLDARQKKVAPRELDEAIEIFVRGFTFTRSFTHPYIAERIAEVWVTRDGPRKRAEDYRREEWVAHGVAPATVDETARHHTRGRFCICAVRGISEPDAPLRAQYKSLGYRLHGTEPIMIHRLGRIPKLPAPFPIRRVATRDLADRLAKAARRREMLEQHLQSDAPLRQYVALDDQRIIGWVKSITVDIHINGDADGDIAPATWVANMYVQPKYRRRGIGKSLLARMLRDDRAAGVTRSALTASHAGAMLYPHVGYEQIGELLLFTPKKG
jgi:GNAT superfamily N-acetyltransferase